MPDRRSEPSGAVQPVEPSRSGTARHADLRSGLLQLVISLILFAAVAAVAAVVWEWVWTAPVGVVLDHHWVAADEAGLRRQFSGTGWFVVVATVAGVLTGGLVAGFLDRVPLLTLAAVVAGSVLGTWVMLRLGAALGPPDPASLAASTANGTRLPDDLQVSGASAWVAMPAGGLVALALVFFGLTARLRPHER